MSTVTVQTHPNLALIKYWGKRNEELMLPTKSSLSIGLAALTTRTTISFATHDNIDLGCTHSPQAIEKVVDYINWFRKRYEIKEYFAISSSNNFPTAAGLASSASGFSALAIGLASLCGLNLNKRELSVLARQGSGSAARSVEGGVVLWHAGTNTDGSDCYAEQLFDEKYLQDLRVLIVIVEDREKKVSSRKGMQLTIQTSPSYNQWLVTSEIRLTKMITALTNKDFLSLGNLAEEDWQGMHTSMLDTQPPLNYWTSTSYAAINTVKKLQQQKIECFFTTDAGPNVFIICQQAHVDLIKQTLEKIPGIKRIIESTIAGKPSVAIVY